MAARLLELHGHHDLLERICVVTGPISGIGREVAEQLAERGAHVVLAARDVGRATALADALRAAHPAAVLEVLPPPLDLASLAAVRAWAAAFLERHSRLDVLIHNAGGCCGGQLDAGWAGRQAESRRKS